MVYFILSMKGGMMAKLTTYVEAMEVYVEAMELYCEKLLAQLTAFQEEAVCDHTVDMCFERARQAIAKG